MLFAVIHVITCVCALLLRTCYGVCASAADDAIAYVDKIFPALTVMLGHGKVSGYGRDNAIELIIKFVTRKDGCGWAQKLVTAGGTGGGGRRLGGGYKDGQGSRNPVGIRLLHA